MEITLPEKYDLNRPEKYILTLKIHPEQFAFTLYNPVDDGSYFYYEFPKEDDMDALSVFKQAFFENSFFTLPFRKIMAMNDAMEYTFVPAFLYEEKYNEALIQFNFSNSTGKLLIQKLRQPELVILHQMPEETYQFLHRSFVNLQFIHSLSPLISYFQERSRLVNANQMIANIRSSGIDIVCFSHGNFMLGNHFNWKQIQDAVYYILFVWKQLKMEQLKDFIYICGDNNKKIDLMNELKPFIHNIIPVNITPNDHFLGVNTNNIPFELTSLTLCDL